MLYWNINQGRVFSPSFFEYVLEQQPGGFSLTLSLSLSLSSEKHMFRIDILYFRATLQPMSKITRYAYVLQQRII